MHACMFVCVRVYAGVRARVYVFVMFVIWWQWWCDYQLAALAASCDHANSISSNKCWKIYRKLYRLLSDVLILFLWSVRVYLALTHSLSSSSSSVSLPFFLSSQRSGKIHSMYHSFSSSLATMCSTLCICHLLIDAYTFKYYMVSQFVFISINVWFGQRSSVKHIQYIYTCIMYIQTHTHMVTQEAANLLHSIQNHYFRKLFDQLKCNHLICCS